jgi:hypothetical protein
VDVAGFGLTLTPVEPALRGNVVDRFRRVGLDGVLADLDRVGSWVDLPEPDCDRAIRWDDRDVDTPRWYPQGVEVDVHADVAGTERPVVLTSWYGHGALGHALLGSRLSVIDPDPDAPRYGHVLLAQVVRLLGLTFLQPVRVHAGGIVRYGDHLYVAASSGGLRVFRLSDIARPVGAWRARGHRHVLPQHTAYRAVTAETVRPMVYSFVSLQRGADGDHLVAGEYGRTGTGKHRLVRYALDRSTGLLATRPDGQADPVQVIDSGIPRMQGVAVDGEHWTISASAGEGNAGDLWTGRPGAFVRRRGVLPTGPEDLALEAGGRRVWTLTEWPGRRWVVPVRPQR